MMFDDDDPYLPRVRELAQALPGTAEKVSHGRPAMFTKKVFCYYGGSLKMEFLEKTGYQVLDTNYRSGRGEIDIVALKEDLLVFVEVKTRSKCRENHCYEKVSWYQKNKIIVTAQEYLNNCNWDGQIRFDIIEVFLDNTREIRHDQAAFD